MKIYLEIKKIKKLFILFLFCSLFFFQFNSRILNALPMKNQQGGPIIEELRLKVPAELEGVWLHAEKEIWEPWLASKEGYLGRQIFWDKEKEEALVLVNWQNKELWKSISMEEVNEIQEQFEENIKLSLNVNLNPFKLIYEGELFKQE